jgi:hypothetical protein
MRGPRVGFTTQRPVFYPQRWAKGYRFRNLQKIKSADVRRVTLYHPVQRCIQLKTPISATGSYPTTPRPPSSFKLSQHGLRPAASFYACQRPHRRCAGSGKLNCRLHHVRLADALLVHVRRPRLLLSRKVNNVTDTTLLLC